MAVAAPPSTETASQFIARVLDLLPFPASEALTGVKAAHDPICYLCGGETGGEGWDRRDAFTASFTNTNLAKVPASVTVCQSCAAVSRGESWAAYAARRPDLGLKTVHPISWRSYPHAITETSHTIPRGEEWRPLLLDPPDPPFVYMIPTTNQKHLLFRCGVAYSRESFPVQHEEDRVWITPSEFREVVEAAERLFALGMSREAVETGRYPQESIRKAGLAAWREAEDDFAPWRARNPAWVRLAAMCGVRPQRQRAEVTA